jgi:ABC-type polysaccharide/polyol phosphate export permease
MTARLRNIRARLPVLRLLVMRDLKLKYEGSFLGYLWSTLEPLLLAFVYTVVFSKIGRVKIADYPLFVVSALIPWLFANSVLRNSARALTSEARLVTATNIPREIWALRVVGVKLGEYLLALPVVVIFAAVLRHGPSLYTLALPVAIVIECAMLTGIALALSALCTVVNDVQRVIQVSARILFYLSPILYDVNLLRHRLGNGVGIVFQVNPMVGILELNRAVWFPDRFVGWGPVVLSGVVSIVMLSVGWTIFIRLERLVLKEL